MTKKDILMDERHDYSRRVDADGRFVSYGLSNQEFMGLLPGSEALQGDWNVDGPDVIGRQGNRGSVLNFMKPPIGSQIGESIDDEP